MEKSSSSRLLCIMVSIATFFAILNHSQAFSQQHKWDYKGKNVKVECSDPIIISIVRRGPAEAGLWGVINSITGENLVEPKYDFIYDFDEYGIACVILGEKSGYINWIGKEITPIIYDKPRWPYEGKFYSGLAIVRKGGQKTKKEVFGVLNTVIENQRFGYINRKGEEVIPVKFAYARPFDLKENRFATVYTGECYIDNHDLAPTSWSELNCGLIDTLGNYLINPGRYSDIENGIGDIFIGQDKNRSSCDLINQDGRVVSNENFNKISNINNLFYRVTKVNNSQYGILDSNLKTIIAPKFDGLTYRIFKNRDIVYTAWLNNDVYFFSGDGSLLTNKKYARAPQNGGKYMNPYIYNNGWSLELEVVIDNNSLWGFIDQTGREVIACQFDYAENFNQNTKLAIVCKNNKYGAINTDGKLIIPFKYERLSNPSTASGARAVLTGTLTNSSGKTIRILLDPNGNEVEITN